MKRFFRFGAIALCMAILTVQAVPLHIDLWRGCTRYKNGNLMLNVGNDVSTLALIGPDNFYGGFILAQSPWQEEPIVGTFQRENDGSGLVIFPDDITLKILPGENEEVKFFLHIPAGRKEKVYLKLMMERFLNGPAIINGKALELTDRSQSIGGIREMIFNSSSSGKGFRITVAPGTGATAFFTTKALCADFFPLKGEDAEFTLYFVPEKAENGAAAGK